MVEQVQLYVDGGVRLRDGAGGAVYLLHAAVPEGGLLCELVGEYGVSEQCVALGVFVLDVAHLFPLQLLTTCVRHCERRPRVASNKPDGSVAAGLPFILSLSFGRCHQSYGIFVR